VTSAPQGIARQIVHDFISAHMNGGCRVLSVGDACQCPLCHFARALTDARDAGKREAFDNYDWSDVIGKAHGDGQASTIADVNAGRIDDLIVPRLTDARREGEEAAFKAGYPCIWVKPEMRYIFDPLMTPGDPDGAYADWLRQRAAQEAEQ